MVYNVIHSDVLFGGGFEAPNLIVINKTSTYTSIPFLNYHCRVKMR